MLTLKDIFAQPDNDAVLKHMKLSSPGDVKVFKAGADGSPFDEGSQIFFHRYAERVPAEARYALELYNVLAHERTARIFALCWGRFTVALRRDFSRSGGVDDDDERRGETFDGAVDLRPLGAGWVLFNKVSDGEDAEVEFEWAYELAGR